MKHIPIKELPVVEPPKLGECGQIFLDAASYIEKHGWCQGTLCNDEGEVCLLGALDAAVYGNPAADPSDARHAARVFANKYFKGSLHGEPLSGLHWCLPQWNDREGRTKEQVVATLRELAWK